MINIKIIIILLLLVIIYHEKKNEKMTNTEDNLYNTIKKQINKYFNIEPTRKLSIACKNIVDGGLSIPKNLEVMEKLILPKDGIIYLKDGDKPIKKLNLNNLLTHGSDVLLQMFGKPLSLACSDHDQTCCNGGRGPCFREFNHFGVCGARHIHSRNGVHINFSDLRGHEWTRHIIFTLEKIKQTIEADKKYKIVPNYDIKEDPIIEKKIKKIPKKVINSTLLKPSQSLIDAINNAK